MRIDELLVEPGRDDHIARHGVTVAEVEEVAYGRPFIRKTRQDRYRLIGQTEAGRYLAIFLAARGLGTFALITAREATEAERRLYRQWRRR